LERESDPKYQPMGTRKDAFPCLPAISNQINQNHSQKGKRILLKKNQVRGV
jgi:hypothetical protein